jgi:hypothetical protein
MFNSNYGRGSSDCLLSVGDSFETIRVFFDGRNLKRKTADAASEVIPRSANSFEGEALRTDPETTTAA